MPRRGKADAISLSQGDNSVFGKLVASLPSIDTPFELPSSIIEEKWHLKIGFADFSDIPECFTFQIPHEFVASLVAREKPPKYKCISRNVFRDPTMKFRRPRVDEIEKCSCFEIDQKNRKAKQLAQKRAGDSASPSSTSRKRNAATLSSLEIQDDIVIQGCGDDCLNRAVQQECSDASCSYEDSSLCTNRQLTRKQYVKVAPVLTEMKGWGLRLDVPVTAGQFLHEYVGDVISTETCISRLKKQYASAKKGRMGHENVHHYFLTLSDGMIIDAQARGGVCRFLNHSCNPNCEIQIWKVDNEPHAGLFARRDITEGTELTIDYRYDGLDENVVKTQPCFCGEPICAKVIGGTRKVVDSKKAKKKRKAGRQAQKRMREIAQGLASDSLCSVCGLGGDLMMCDGTVDGRDCPRCYHFACLNKTEVPAGKWICPYHFCDGCGKNPVVFCRTCSDSWCKPCAANLGDKLKPAPEVEEDTGRVEFVVCPECILEPLNPMRDAKVVSQILKQVEEQQAIAERILKGFKTEALQIQCEGVSFEGPTIPKESLPLLVAATINKRSLPESLCKQLVKKLGVHQNKITEWFAANQILLENPLNFIFDKAPASDVIYQVAAVKENILVEDNEDKVLVEKVPVEEKVSIEEKVLIEMAIVDGNAVEDSVVEKVDKPTVNGSVQSEAKKMISHKRKGHPPAQRKRLSALAAKQ